MAIEIWRPGWGLSSRKPFHSLGEAEKIFEDFFGRSYLPSAFHRTPFSSEEWAPSIDVFEKDNTYIVKAELPGMKEEDIDVSISDNVLTIKGERSSEDEVKDDDYYCCERSYGSFYRSISLPSNTDSGKAKASLTDGILEVTVPKEKESSPKKISVSSTKKEAKNVKSISSKTASNKKRVK